MRTKGCLRRGWLVLQVAAEALALALIVGLGVGYGGQLYVPPGHFNSFRILDPTGALIGVVSFGVVGALIFLPLEIVLALGWLALRTTMIPRGGVFSRFHWYYLPIAYVMGIAVGLALAVAGLYPRIAI